MVNFEMHCLVDGGRVVFVISLSKFPWSSKNVHNRLAANCVDNGLKHMKC